MIPVHCYIHDIQTTYQPKRKQCSVSHTTSTSARNGDGSAYKVHKVSIMHATSVNCQPRKTRFEQCSRLFCFKPREIHRPTMMEFLHSKTVLQRLTENERWRAIGMVQNGNIQLNVAGLSNVSQSIVSRLWNRYQQSGRPYSITQRRDHLLVTNALRDLIQNTI